MPAIFNPALTSAIGSQPEKRSFILAAVSAMTTTRRLKVNRNGVTQRQANLTGAWGVSASAITNPGVVGSVTGSASINLGDGATWELVLEGGPSFSYTISIPLTASGGEVNTTLAGTSQAMGFSAFKINAPAYLPSTETLLTLTKTSAGTETNYTISRAFVFEPGQIYTDPRPRINGVPVPDGSWQSDKKRLNGDGSCDYAIVSWVIPSWAQNQSLAISFMEGTSNNTPIAPATISSTYSVDQNIRLNGGGTNLEAQATAMIAAGAHSYWLSGPVVTELEIADFTTKAFDIGAEATKVVRPIFHLQAIGIEQKVRCMYRAEVIDLGKWGDATYSIEARAGSTVQFSQGSRTHRAGQIAIPGLDWFAGTGAKAIIKPNEVWNTAHWDRCKASLRRDALALNSSRRATVLSNWASAVKTLGGAGMWLKNQPDPSTRYDLGLENAFDVFAIVDGGADLWEMSRQNALLALSWPMFFREGAALRGGSTRYYDSVNSVAAIGKPVTKNGRPTFNVVSATIDAVDQTTNVNTLGGNDGWVPDLAHMPAIGAVQYLTTGWKIFYDIVQFQASFAATNRNPGVGFDVGSSPDPTVTVSKNPQTRGSAWNVRDLANAARFASNGPDRVYRERAQVEGAESLLGAYADTAAVGTGQRVYYFNNRSPAGNTQTALGFDSLVPFTGGSAPAAAPSGGQSSPFQYEFLSMATLLAKRSQSHPVLNELANWGTKMYLGLINASGSSGLNASAYIVYTVPQINVLNTDSYYTTWAASATAAGGSINGPAFSTADGYGMAAHLGSSYGNYACQVVAMAKSEGIAGADTAATKVKADLYDLTAWNQLPQCYCQPTGGW